MRRKDTMTQMQVICTLNGSNGLGRHEEDKSRRNESEEYQKIQWNFNIPNLSCNQYIIHRIYAPAYFCFFLSFFFPFRSSQALAFFRVESVASLTCISHWTNFSITTIPLCTCTSLIFVRATRNDSTACCDTARFRTFFRVSQRQYMRVLTS